MATELQNTWDDIAHHFDDWGPPLRPCPEDLQIVQQVLVRWHAWNPVRLAQMFLCGVTPEIAKMSWPFAINLLGMDQAESMVRVVWPGDISGTRRAVVGNWTNSGLAPESQDVVISDGGFAWFDYPVGIRQLTLILRTLLKPGGLFVYRHFAQSDRRETLGEVIDDMVARKIGNFHIFKWRVAMALQAESCRGVSQHEIWQACQDAGVDSVNQSQPGWSAREINTIRFYKGKDSRLYFPTLDEFRAVLAEVFDEVEVAIPMYELGDRCPTLSARVLDGDPS